MKKLFTIFALLCASVMGWAGSTPYCNVVSPNANFTFSLMNISGNLYRIQFDAIGDDKFASTPYNVNCGVNQTIGAGIGFGNEGWVMTEDRAYKDFSTSEASSVPTGFWGNSFAFNKKGGGLILIENFNPSDVDWTATCGASCSDSEAPSVTAVSVGSITYNSAVLTITASDNVAVTRYVVKNGENQIAQGTSNEIALTGLTSGTTYNNIKVFAYDACNNESSAFAVASFDTEELTYCRYATGHLGQANFGDTYGRILLTIKKVDNSTIAVKVEPNNNGAKGIKYLNIVVNGTNHEYGNSDGSGDDLTGFHEISGLESLNFTMNVWFYCNTPNWTTNQFSVTENQLCPESPVVLSESSEYCEYGLACAHGDGDYAYLSWNTTEDGDVVISIVDGPNSTNAQFRGNGFEGDFDAGFKVLSGTGFATEENASTYFNRILPHGDRKTFTLQRKGGKVLPSPAKIKFTTNAVAWLCDQHNDGYKFETFTYTYGTTCPVVSGYAVSASANDGTMGSATATVGSEAVTHAEDGTTVKFIATANDTYTFVNWTKNNVVVSTNPIYEVEIHEATALVANFDYIRNTYCHTEVLSAEGKKFYMTLGSIGNGKYQIKFEGSSEAKITGLNDANFVINGVVTDWDDDGDGCPFTKANDAWSFDNSGYGSYSTTFELYGDWKNINAWNHFIYFACEGLGQQTLTDAFPNRYRITWNETCADETAPVMTAPTATALNTTDVRLTLSATDNWKGIITYNINYKPTGDAGAGVDVETSGASGATVTYDILGLTTNTEYTFTVTAKDASNNVCAAQSCTATPAGDVTAPTNVSIIATALTNTIVRLTLSADDDYAGDITYNIAYDNAGVASTSAERGTTTTLDITGLTADTEYHFAVVATDAANNSADAVNAVVVRTYVKNLALIRPCEAGHETDNAGEAKATGNDGNPASRWSSYGSTNKGTLDTEDWWYVQFDNVYALDRVRISWQDARSDNLNIYTSMDGINWDLVDNFEGMPASSANGTVYTDYELGGAQGRYVKVLSLHDYFNGQWGISFWELEAYGTLANDAVAPVISEFTADGASTTSVLLKATADDNFKGDLTYTFYCNDVAQGEPVVKASGVEATYTVNGLIMGTDYNFKVNVSDGTNSTMSAVVVGTPISDNAAPEDVIVTSEATDHSITLTLSATDNLGGMIYYTVTCGETVKNAEALSGANAEVTFDGLDYDTPYAFSIVAKDGSDNEAAAVAHNKSTLPATYPTSSAPAPAFAEASVRPVYCATYNKDCNFADWGGSYVEKQTYGAKKLNEDKAYFGIVDFGTIKVDADDELYLSVWTNENIQFRVVPIIRNAENTDNLPERGAFTQELIGGQWNVVRFTMSDFNLDNLTPSTGYENYDKIYQIKIDNAGNQTFWLDNIYFHRKGALNETDNADFIAANDNQGQDVKLSRTFPNTDEWYTLCLPFDLNDAQLTAALGAGYTVAEMVGAEDRGSLIHLNFDYIHSFEAGKAYLIRPGVGVTENPVFEGVTVKNVDPAALKSANTYMEFQGTFNAINLEGENKRFVGAENYLYSPRDGGTPMGAFRCYFTIPDGSPASAPGRRAKIFFGEQNPTDVETVANDAQATKFIENGQLYIIRDNRTYNAQGMLVK